MSYNDFFFLQLYFDTQEYYHERLQKTQGQQGAPATPLIGENINLIKQLCFRLDAVFMVIDTLDECPERKDFSRGLRSFLEENENIKLLLTSRQEVELERPITP